MNGYSAMRSLFTGQDRYGVFQVLTIIGLGSFVLLYPYSVKWANGCILAATAFSLLTSSLHEKRRRLNEAKGLLIMPVYFLLLCIGVLYSDNLLAGWQNIERSLVFLFAPLAVATTPVIDLKWWYRAGWLITLNTIVAAAYCTIRDVLWFYANDLPLSRFFDWEYTNEHVTDFIGLHPTYFAILVLMAIYMIVFHSSYKSIYTWIINIVALLFLVVFIILLGVKSALLILFVFTNVVLLASAVSARRAWLVVVFVLLNGAMIIAALRIHVIYWRFVMAYDSLRNTLSGESLSDYRYLQWKCATRAIAERPIFGWGTGDSRIPLNECYESMNMAELLNYNAHNLFLETWIKIGIPGVVAVGLCVFYPLVRSIRLRHYFFTSVFLTYFAISMTESIFSVQKGIAMFAMLAAVYLGHICTFTPSKSTRYDQ
jgi:O-antigen ligase